MYHHFIEKNSIMFSLFCVRPEGLKLRFEKEVCVYGFLLYSSGDEFITVVK
jgi:hypothetical protein